MLLVILFLGLNPKDFYLFNNVKWIADQNGISFGKYGMAYTDSSFSSFQSYFEFPKNLSLEIALKPEDMNDERFKFLLVLHNGEDSKQFLIGQWHSSIILMNGDDYNSKKGTKKIAVRDALLPQKISFITITSGEEGTKVYLDGQLAATKKDLFLKVPNEYAKARLIVGNSIYGRHSWKGDIYGLAIYGYTLTVKDAEFHFKRWSKERNFSFAKEDAPEVLYLFDEKVGELAYDQAGRDHHLKIPSIMRILKREILVTPWHGVKLNRPFLQDIIINILGFIPLGFLLNVLFINMGGIVERHNCLITVSFCLVISLIIEIAQSWMPSRSSQMLDLMLNTFGALLGVMLYQFYLRFYQKAERI
jgi:hypothetical protein